jgi:hypothetical protein
LRRFSRFSSPNRAYDKSASLATVGNLSPLQKWGPVVAQWVAYALVVAGTSALFLAAGDAGVLGLTVAGGERAAAIFPLVVSLSTVINYAFTSTLNGGERVAKSMGGYETTDQGLLRMVHSVYGEAGLGKLSRLKRASSDRA